MQPREEKLMKYLVETIAGRLESVFNEAAEGSCFAVTGTAFRVTVTDGDWADGEKLLKGVIGTASEIVGKNKVNKEVGAVLADTEDKLGTNLYEIFFRLGLHHYR